MNFLDFQSIHPNDLIRALIYLVACLIVLAAGKWIYNLLRPGINANEELVEKDNPAFAVQQTGYWTGLLIVLGGTLVGPSSGLMLDLFDLFLWGFIGIILINISIWLNDKFVLMHFDNRKEIIEDQNAGTGAVEAGSAIASGLLVYGAISGEGGGLVTALICWAIGQVSLIIAGFAYTKFVSYNIHEQIEDHDNVPAGVAFGGALIAVGNLIRIGIEGDFESWSVLLADFLVYTVLALILLPIIRIAADKILLPGRNISDEIANQDKPNLGAGLIEAFAYISVSVLIGWVV
jgi:uncharacterized membrane protein YjfL (UPF0719 family)